MNFTATYLDNSFYVVSDKAAGVLCSVIGQKLPRHGYEKFVMLTANGHNLNAWLKRCDLRASMRMDIQHARGWRWTLYALRTDGTMPDVTLGASFTFQPIASTQASVAA